MVKLSDEEDFKLVKVHKLDPIHDIAILKLSNKIKHEFLKFESYKVKVGTEILVAGTPIGFEGTLSDGIVSSIRKEEPYDFDLIQITAPISHGSSGGPVINKKGNLIGISKSGIDSDVAQNINFAVPSKYIEFLLK
jgi:S1-C subfamily serine protease